jgi:hypothetical protein
MINEEDDNIATVLNYNACVFLVFSKEQPGPIYCRPFMLQPSRLQTTTNERLPSPLPSLSNPGSKKITNHRFLLLNMQPRRSNQENAHRPLSLLLDEFYPLHFWLDVVGRFLAPAVVVVVVVVVGRAVFCK